jgi:hypothetical protein
VGNALGILSNRLLSERPSQKPGQRIVGPVRAFGPLVPGLVFVWVMTHGLSRR